MTNSYRILLVKKIALLAVWEYVFLLGGVMLLDTRIQEILKTSKSIAIIGAKDKQGQDVDMVGRYLIWAGYEVYPVHPKRQNVWGLPTYKSLEDIPAQVDIVNVFRAPQYCPIHAEEVLKHQEKGYRTRCFWMQLGISSPEAAKLLAAHQIQVVENLCIKIVHNQIFGA